MTHINEPALSPRFKELNEKDVKNLYNLSSIRRLQAGEILIEEDASDQAVHLLLEGELKMVKKLGGKEKKIVQLRRDKESEGVAFMGQSPWKVSIVATEQSMVMTINHGGFNALDEKVQLYFYKCLHRFDVDFVCDLLEYESQLVQHKEQYQAYLLSLHKDAHPDYAESGLIQGILNKIPRLPIFTGNLATSLLDDEISTKDVAEMVKADPPLAATVLKTVNSSLYNFGKNISDINHAVILLGFNELYQLVVAEGINRTMPKSIDFREILSHSICISRIAFALSFASHVGKPAEVSTIGLLHDLGDTVKHLLKKQNQKVDILIEYLDTAAIGALLLKQWNLPEKVWQSIEFQNYPKFVSPGKIPQPFRENVAILFLSHICYAILQGRAKTETATPFLDDYKQLLKVENFSDHQITQKLIMPFLLKNLHTFPAFFRKLITTHTSAYSVLD